MSTKYLLDSPYFTLFVASCVCALAVQFYKLGMRKLGLRHASFVERTMMLVPVVIGAGMGAAFGDYIGIDAVLKTGGEQKPPWTLHLIYGALLIGFPSMGVFQFVLEWFPEDSPIRDALKVNGTSGGETDG